MMYFLLIFEGASAWRQTGSNLHLTWQNVVGEIWQSQLGRQIYQFMHGEIATACTIRFKAVYLAVHYLWSVLLRGRETWTISKVMKDRKFFLQKKKKKKKIFIWLKQVYKWQNKTNFKSRVARKPWGQPCWPPKHTISCTEDVDSIDSGRCGDRAGFRQPGTYPKKTRWVFLGTPT